MSKSKLPIYPSTLVFLLILILLTSCSSSDQKTKYIDLNKNPTLVDQSWYKDKECIAPCWHGLEVEISTKKESLEVVKTLTFIDFEKSTQTDTFPCKSPPEQDCMAMTFMDEKLDSIWLYLNYQITFEQVVDEIGLPDSFYYVRSSPEGKGCLLDVVWIKRQIELSYSDNPSAFEDDLCNRIHKGGDRLPKDLVVRQVHYMTSDQMSELVEIVQKPNTGYNYIIWNGFAE